jgi:NTP pyrophosphatase (non-canonical NTP hydrolase)
LNFLKFLRRKNIERSIEWCNGDSPGVMFATVEFCGEAGELADAVKKLYRAMNNMTSSMSNEEASQAVEEEIADVMITLDLVAREFDIDIEEVTRRKFNKTSAKYNLSVFMGGDENDSDD